MCLAAADPDSVREVRCDRCEAVFHVCRDCDTGQIYCPETCSVIAFRERCQKAHRQYRGTFQGARVHAAAEARRRCRAKIVGDRGQQEVAPTGRVGLREVPPAAMTAEDERPAQGLPDDATAPGDQAVVDDDTTPFDHERGSGTRDVTAAAPSQSRTHDADRAVAMAGTAPVRCAVCGRGSQFVRAEPLRRLGLRRRDPTLRDRDRRTG